MNDGSSARMLIMATDESVALYRWKEAPWVEWVYLGWVVAGAAVTVWFLIMIVRRQRGWLPLTVLGVASVGLIAGGFFVQLGQGTYTGDEGMRGCVPARRASTRCGSPKQTD